MDFSLGEELVKNSFSLIQEEKNKLEKATFTNSFFEQMELNTNIDWNIIINGQYPVILKFFLQQTSQDFLLKVISNNLNLFIENKQWILSVNKSINNNFDLDIIIDKCSLNSKLNNQLKQSTKNKNTKI